MKCPYNNFNNCIIEKCPSCEYETEVITHEKYVGELYKDDIGNQKIVRPHPVTKEIMWWERQEVRNQNMYYVKDVYKTEEENMYHFKSCKLVDNNVAPTPSDITNVDVKQETNVHNTAISGRRINVF